MTYGDFGAALYRPVMFNYAGSLDAYRYRVLDLIEESPGIARSMVLQYFTNTEEYAVNGALRTLCEAGYVDYLDNRYYRTRKARPKKSSYIKQEDGSYVNKIKAHT